ncbi:uncharacterized protein LOC143286057 [Babylonia areolata]|uniref:uncharacterized protein LOC143286057 n=1 Tax=Babylonia areolata TaxID=304850 RepID=UPI003FD04528
MENVSDQFVCGQCQEQFDSLTAFLLHKVLHVDMGKPAGCPLCGMAFSRQTSLREHLCRKHNIPELKCSSVKRNLQQRKELSGKKISPEKLSIPTSEVKEAAPCDSSDPQSYLGQAMMHHIVEKISEGDFRQCGTSGLSDAVIHADCSVACSPNSATEVVGTCGDGDFGHLMEQVNHVSPHTFQPHSLQNHADGLQNQSHSMQCQSITLKNSSQIPENHLHLLQPLQNYSETQPVTEQEVCIEEGEVTEAVATRKDDISTSENQSSLPLQQQIQLSSATMESGSLEEPGLDFFFVLLTNHVKRKSVSYNKQSFRCFHCQYKTFWRRALVKHMRDTHSDNLDIHQCIAVCNSEKIHGQQVMKMSDYLSMLAQQRKQVNGHRIRGVERQDLPGYHPCNKCGKEFVRLRYLRKHQMIHKAEKKFLCDDCGKAFKTKAYLAAHRQTHQTKVYKCSQCDFTSSINALIHTHRQLHNDNSVICEVCGSAYNDRATLKKHKQVHDKSRPFPCSYPGCTWRFKSEVMCRAHYRAHTTPGRFVCDLCSYVFRHKHHLQRHLSKIHGMDEATIHRATCSTKNIPSSKSLAMKDVEDKEYVEKGDNHPMSDSVSLIVNTGLSSEQLQSVLESGQFVIATDDNDSSVNYEIANIAMNVSYDTFIDSAGTVSEGQTVFIPSDAECSQIIFQHDPGAVSSVET